VTCSPRTAAWQAVPGTAYAIVVFDDENPGPGAGGNLVLSITETRLPEIELTVDPLGAFNRTTGEATVSGTVVCTGDDAEGALEVQLTQRVDALKIVGFGGTPVTCDGVVRPWSVLVTSGNGYYTRGPADAVTTGSVCANALCTNYLNEQPVELRPAQRVRS
jgi:hypothetical protein